MTYFVYLKSWFLFLLCSLFSSKNLFNFLDGGGGARGGGPSYSTSRGGKGFNDSMILDGIREGGRSGVKKTQF